MHWIPTGQLDQYKAFPSFLKDYQSELTGLEAAAAKLQTSKAGNVFTELEAGSTDESVATANRSWRLEAGMDVNLEVHSVAQAQKNVSVANQAADLAEEDMEFEEDLDDLEFPEDINLEEEDMESGDIL